MAVFFGTAVRQTFKKRSKNVEKTFRKRFFGLPALLVFDRQRLESVSGRPFFWAQKNASNVKKTFENRKLKKTLKKRGTNAKKTLKKRNAQKKIRSKFQT